VCSEQLNNATLEERARQQALQMMKLRAEKQQAMIVNLAVEVRAFIVFNLVLLTDKITHEEPIAG
jgi:hypothetical protein